MTVALLPALAWLVGGFSQDVPPSGSCGSITSREFKQEIREGNRVVATQFFTLTYEVTYSLEPTADTQFSHTFACSRSCNGKKHKEHAECDGSCDEPCPERDHKFTMRGWYVEHRGNMDQAEKDANQGAINSGGTTDQRDWSSAVSNLRRQVAKMARKPKKVEVAHWAKSCELAEKSYQYRRHALTITGTFRRRGFTMSMGVRTPIPDAVTSTHTAHIADAWLPEDKPYFDKTEVFCKCKIDKDWEEVEKAFQGFLDALGGIQVDEPKNHQTGTTLPEGCKAVVKGKDLFNCTLEFSNMTEMPFRGALLPGTRLIPDDPGVQTMTVTERANITLLGGISERLARAGTPIVVEPFDTITVNVKVLCSEMAKKEPTPRTTFTMAQPNDAVVARLSRFTGASNLKGAWDQSRLWIYTDAASLADVNKRLTPDIPGGFYVNNLHEVARFGGVDLADARFKPCLDPSALLETSARPQSTEHFVTLLTETDPKGLASFVDKSHAAFLAYLAKSHDELDLRHVAALGGALTASADKGVRLAGLRWLIGAVPGEIRAGVARMGALGGVREALRSGDKEEATVALQVVAAYRFEGARPTLMDLAEYAEDGDLKAKAAETLNSLGRPPSPAPKRH